MESLFSISQSILSTPALTRTPVGICYRLRGPAFITSVSPKLTGKLGADKQKASIWNYNNSSWFREKRNIRNPFQIAQGEKLGRVVCVLKCHVILRADYIFVTGEQLPQQSDFHLWAPFAASGSDPWCLLGLSLVHGCEARAQPPCCVSWAETPATGFESRWVRASRCEGYLRLFSACSLQAPRGELRCKDILQVSVSAQPNWLCPFNQALHEDT